MRKHPFRFYTGMHNPRAIERDDFVDVPVCLSYSRLAHRKTFPTARQPILLDSSGFSRLKKDGCWPFSVRHYINNVRRIIKGLGRMPDGIAPMDAMTENPIIYGTPHLPRDHPGWCHGTKAWRGIPDDQPDEPIRMAEFKHQWWTITNYKECIKEAPDLPIFPVLQGQDVEGQVRCADMYRRAGIDLRRLPMVAIGSVCRKQNTAEIEEIVSTIAVEFDLDNIHGLGVKSYGLELAGEYFASADSMAWSKAYMHAPLLPGHEGRGHKNCANCPEAALIDRERVLSTLAKPRPRKRYQPRLWLRHDEAIA